MTSRNTAAVPVTAQVTRRASEEGRLGVIPGLFPPAASPGPDRPGSPVRPPRAGDGATDAPDRAGRGRKAARRATAPPPDGHGWSGIPQAAAGPPAAAPTCAARQAAGRP